MMADIAWTSRYLHLWADSGQSTWLYFNPLPTNDPHMRHGAWTNRKLYGPGFSAKSYTSAHGFGFLWLVGTHFVPTVAFEELHRWKFWFLTSLYGQQTDSVSIFLILCVVSTLLLVIGTATGQAVKVLIKSPLYLLHSVSEFLISTCFSLQVRGLGHKIAGKVLSTHWTISCSVATRV